MSCNTVVACCRFSCIGSVVSDYEYCGCVSLRSSALIRSLESFYLCHSSVLWSPPPYFVSLGRLLILRAPPAYDGLVLSSHGPMVRSLVPVLPHCFPPGRLSPICLLLLPLFEANFSASLVVPVSILVWSLVMWSSLLSVYPVAVFRTGPLGRVCPRPLLVIPSCVSRNTVFVFVPPGNCSDSRLHTGFVVVGLGLWNYCVTQVVYAWC